MNNDLIFALKELEKRALPQLVIDDLFDEQRAVCKSKKRKKAVLTSRRAGKSYCLASYFISECVRKKTKCLYLALTRNNVKRIVYDIIKEICSKFKIDMIINKTNLIFSFPNGSTIELGGGDTTIENTERYLGAYFDLIAIDEAGSYDPDTLDYLIDIVLSPTQSDKDEMDVDGVASE